MYVRNPSARRYIIRVRANGTVRVTIPRRGSMREAVAFAAAEHAWIRQQLEKLAHEPCVAREELHPDVVRGLRARAALELPPLVVELAARHGLAVSRVSVRNQRSRWGSCSRTGHVCLNWRLVTMPGWVRDYVIIHELMHLKRMDHSPQFWALVAAACPRYQDARAWLRRQKL
jgi:predicted metal-dependent hydrolase